MCGNLANFKQSEMKDRNALIINHSDVNEGGASFAGFNIYQGLASYSRYNTFMLCARKKSDEANISEIPIDVEQGILQSTTNRIKTKIFSQYFGGEYWSLRGESVFEHPFYKQAQVVNIHNLHGEEYFSYSALGKIVKEKPIVLTMQDMWYFTGHCAFSYECKGYETGCRKCDFLDYYPPLNYDKAGFHFKNKMNLYKNKNIHFISCSRWFADIATKVLDNNGIIREVHHVNNPIETTKLFGVDNTEKENLKIELNVPLDKKIICFGAAQIAEPRKGLVRFLERIDKELVKKHNLYLILVGNEIDFDIAAIPSCLPYRLFGNVTDVIRRNLIYNIADLFVFPSVADDLPNMILESLCAELPVVCFDIGGNKEVVINNTSGYLARKGDYNDFFHGIDVLLSESAEKFTEIKKNARKLIMQQYSMEECTDKYEKIFNNAYSIFQN